MEKIEVVDVHEVYRTDMVDFGKWVLEKRKEMGLSLDKLAVISGVDKSYINRIEKGNRSNPSFITVCALSHALGRNIENILKIRDVPTV